jgi:hypothetical protein
MSLLNINNFAVKAISPGDIEAADMQVRSYKQPNGAQAEYKAGSFKMAGKSPRFSFGPLTSKWGISFKDNCVPSLGFPLDPDVPAEKHVIDQLEVLMTAMKPHVLKHKLKGITAATYETLDFFNYPVNPETNEPMRGGKRTLYVPIQTSGKWVTRVYLGRKLLTQEEILQLNNVSLTCKVEWGLNYMYAGSNTKFMTTTFEIAISSAVRREAPTTFKAEVDAFSEEETSRLLSVLQAKDATTATDKKRDAEATDDETKEVKKNKANRFMQEGSLSLDEILGGEH